MSRKITLEIDESIRCLFINYVSVSLRNGMVMGSKSVSTSEILTANETGKPIVIDEPIGVEEDM